MTPFAPIVVRDAARRARRLWFAFFDPLSCRLYVIESLPPANPKATVMGPYETREELVVDLASKAGNKPRLLDSDRWTPLKAFEVHWDEERRL